MFEIAWTFLLRRGCVCYEGPCKMFTSLPDFEREREREWEGGRWKAEWGSVNA